MKKFWIKTRNSLMALSLASFFTIAATDTILAAPGQLEQDCVSGFVLVDGRCELRIDYSADGQTITIPTGIGQVSIELLGASGGLGGLDCGSGCTAARSGPVGQLVLKFDDLSGKQIKIYPGGAGGAGASGVSGSGGGQGGVSPYKNLFNGGRGGNAGSTGTSGAGGGGGAATVLVIDGEEYIAAGGGGGGGSANSINGSKSGSNNGRISKVSVPVNVAEYSAATFNAPAGKSFVSSQLRWEAANNSRCGKVISPSVAGKFQVIINANNETWGDSCVGSAKRVTGFLYYGKGSQGGDGLDSNCQFFCDGGGGGGGGAGRVGGAGGILYQAPDGGLEAAGFGGSTGSNSPVAGPVLLSEYVQATGNGSAVIRYRPKTLVSSMKFLESSPTGLKNFKLEVRSDADLALQADEISFSGPATTQTDFQASRISKRNDQGQTVYLFDIRQKTNAQVQGELVAKVRDLEPAVLILDQARPTAQLVLQPETLRSAVKVYDIKFSKSIQSLTTTDFVVSGSAKGCKIGYLIGENANYQLSLEGCLEGTFGIKLLANSVTDSGGNLGPSLESASELSKSNSPEVTLQISEGKIPTEFLEKQLEIVLSKLDSATRQELESIGIYAPMPGAPIANLVTDLTTSLPTDAFSYQSQQQVEVGSSVDLSLRVSPEIADTSEVIAFMQTGNLWQYLGRAGFTDNAVSAETFGIAKEGIFKIRFVVIPKELVTTMTLPRSFGQALPLRISRAVTDAETNLSAQQVDISITAVAPAGGLPEVVTELSPETPEGEGLGEGLFEIELPTLNVGQPVANPAIGATGDDNAPSVPFDPLGSPESVAQVVKTTATTVAVVSSVAAAAAGAAGAAAGASGASSSSSSSSSSASASSSSQNVQQEDGEIANIDAQVESFTSTHTGWGDRIPIFKLNIFTFLDKFTHDLTVKISKFSPVISKIVNDGAYLRAQLGSLWLAFPAGAVALAVTALSVPSTELSPPVWQLFIAISVLGLFDAFSGLLATSIFVIGMISTYGISSVSDIRMMLGVIVMGFGPALISVAFRQIRKHFETGFTYFWDRLVDIAVLLFFTGWTASAMVATLPALAGRTLSAANHVADFGFFLSIAIVIRILLEELATRSFAQRLDKINPTEVLETSQLQKVLSTLMRLGVFVFVTAAFMGNTWQVWVGSIIFILPNVFSWFEDKLPNSPLLWKLIPTGVPGLAFSLLVASYSSLYLGQWLGDLPDFAQWSFLLLPIPMFLVGLIGLFGREGEDGEDRPIKKPRWRYLYRVGGIVMLAITAQLAGVI